MEHVTPFGVSVLIGSAIYHAIVGILSLVSVNWTRKVAKALYGLNLPENLDPRYEYTLKPLGAYAIFVAAVSMDAALSPGSPVAAHSLGFLALLFLLRALGRAVYRDLFSRAYQTNFRRNLVNIIFNLVLVTLVLVFGFSSTGA